MLKKDLLAERQEALRAHQGLRRRRGRLPFIGRAIRLDRLDLKANEVWAKHEKRFEERQRRSALG